MLVIFLLAAFGPSIPQVDVNKIRMSASNPSPRIGRRRREVASAMRRRRGIKSGVSGVATQSIFVLSDTPLAHVHIFGEIGSRPAEHLAGGRVSPHSSFPRRRMGALRDAWPCLSPPPRRAGGAGR
jgi:hypothetical protein